MIGWRACRVEAAESPNATAAIAALGVAARTGADALPWDESVPLGDAPDIVAISLLINAALHQIRAVARTSNDPAAAFNLFVDNATLTMARAADDFFDEVEGAQT